MLIIRRLGHMVFSQTPDGRGILCGAAAEPCKFVLRWCIISEVLLLSRINGDAPRVLKLAAAFGWSESRPGFNFRSRSHEHPNAGLRCHRYIEAISIRSFS